VARGIAGTVPSLIQMLVDFDCDPGGLGCDEIGHDLKKKAGGELPLERKPEFEDFVHTLITFGFNIREIDLSAPLVQLNAEGSDASSSSENASRPLENASRSSENAEGSDGSRFSEERDDLDVGGSCTTS
jgi:hypothetical protein